MLRKLVTIMLSFVMSLLFVTPVSAGVPYSNYTYDWNRVPQEEPQAYIPYDMLTGERLGTTPLNEPKDIFVTAKGSIYIADTGNNRIIILNNDFTVNRIIDEFTKDNIATSFSKPSGIFVAKNGDLYVADTGNSRIVVFDSAGNCKNIFNKPDSILIENKLAYSPVKVVVDPSNRIFVLSENEIKGLLSIEKDGCSRQVKLNTFC